MKVLEYRSDVTMLKICGQIFAVEQNYFFNPTVAAINKNGELWIYEEAPRLINDEEWESSCGGFELIAIVSDFDDYTIPHPIEQLN